MNTEQQAKRAYELAKDYLLGFKEVTPKLLEDHLRTPERRTSLAGIDGVYYRLLESAQNAGMGPGVIGKAIGGLDNLNDVAKLFSRIGSGRFYLAKPNELKIGRKASAFLEEAKPQLQTKDSFG
ncbi:MAG: hypothetical protein WCF84_17415 [Anaerolineae bacterium]